MPAFTSMPRARYVTAMAFAAYLGCSRRTIQRAIIAGKLPASRLPPNAPGDRGGVWVIHEVDMRAYLAQIRKGDRVAPLPESMWR